MILWRVLPWRPHARAQEPGGVLWFPRELQGAGRHDNPDLYGCLYVGENPVSPIAEALAPFRGTGALTDGMLLRAGTRLALAELWLADDSRVLDLDDPAVLLDTGLRPSQVATTARGLTQAYAARLHDLRPSPAALRWWSTIEASLINLTIFEGAQPALDLIDVTPLTLEDDAVREAAEMLGLLP
ncbi:MAG: RES family NAD+ phosphorylase [Acidimicrobiales bacterium]